MSTIRHSCCVLIFQSQTREDLYSQQPPSAGDSRERETKLFSFGNPIRVILTQWSLSWPWQQILYFYSKKIIITCVSKINQCDLFIRLKIVLQLIWKRENCLVFKEQSWRALEVYYRLNLFTPRPSLFQYSWETFTISLRKWLFSGKFCLVGGWVGGWVRGVIRRWKGLTHSHSLRHAFTSLQNHNKKNKKYSRCQ